MSHDNHSKLLPPVCSKGHTEKLRSLSNTARQKPLPPDSHNGTPVVHLQTALARHCHLQDQIVAVSADNRDEVSQQGGTMN